MPRRRRAQAFPLTRPAPQLHAIQYIRRQAKALASRNVLVNCITPAAARTGIFDQMTQQHIDYMLSKIPMNRFLKVEEVAAMASWLASEDCSFSTGAVFDISGGRAVY
jgi:3-oxoacyl-[acyl-carrier protein] reductase